VLITFVVDAIEWNRWIKFYIQIVIYHYFTSGHDPYDVLWVVRLVLEDMGELEMLVVKLCWVIFNGLIFMLWCYSANGAMWMSTIWYWYVPNVSIIFDAPCLFLHYLPYVSLHFVAFFMRFPELTHGEPAWATSWRRPFTYKKPPDGKP
jgi:hypothetical protein